MSEITISDEAIPPQEPCGGRCGIEDCDLDVEGKPMNQPIQTPLCDALTATFYLKCDDCQSNCEKIKCVALDDALKLERELFQERQDKLTAIEEFNRRGNLIQSLQSERDNIQIVSEEWRIKYVQETKLSNSLAARVKKLEDDLNLNGPASPGDFESVLSDRCAQVQELESERDKLHKRVLELEKDITEAKRDAASEQNWKHKQGDDYGTY